MADAVWKEFEENQLTHSAAHYLCTVRDLLESQGYARVTDIARALNITRGSCSISLKPLKRRGLIIEDDNRHLKLSEEGKRLAELVEFNDQLLEKLFSEVLGISKEQSEIDACKVEHLISLETSMHLANFIECWQSDSKAAKAFKQELAKHLGESCSNDTLKCSICNDLCFMNHELPDFKVDP